MIRAGGTLVYGGHLREGGFTVFLESEIDRYGGPQGALHLVIPWSEHRQMTLEQLHRHEDQLSLSTEITYLDANGKDVDLEAGRGDAPAGVDDVPAALTGLRRRLVLETHARVLIGGKERGYQGDLPGIVQEAALAIEAGQPLYLAGGFGGATATIAARVAALNDRWPPAEVETDLGPIEEAIRSAGWELTNNGLTAEQNRLLATTHRPSEVASLVAIGLREALSA